jgi:hypothetical protein
MLDISVGLAAIAVAAVAVYFFLRASGESKSVEEAYEEKGLGEKEAISTSSISPAREIDFQMPELNQHLNKSDVERAQSNIRTLTLQNEILGTVIKRLFEAEDEGEITGEERIRLSRGYEADLKKITEELKRSELVVSLHELETIREDILKKFEATLNSTQTRIDSILKELKLEDRKKTPPKGPSKIKTAAKKKEETIEELKEEDDEETEDKEVEKTRRKPRSEVEAKLEQLRKEVLKELEELEKLDIEI